MFVIQCKNNYYNDIIKKIEKEYDIVIKNKKLLQKYINIKYITYHNTFSQIEALKHYIINLELIFEEEIVKPENQLIIGYLKNLSNVIKSICLLFYALYITPIEFNEFSQKMILILTNYHNDKTEIKNYLNKCTNLKHINLFKKILINLDQVVLTPVYLINMKFNDILNLHKNAKKNIKFMYKLINMTLPTINTDDLIIFYDCFVILNNKDTCNNYDISVCKSDYSKNLYESIVCYFNKNKLNDFIELKFFAENIFYLARNVITYCWCKEQMNNLKESILNIDKLLSLLGIM